MTILVTMPMIAMKGSAHKALHGCAPSLGLSPDWSIVFNYVTVYDSRLIASLPHALLADSLFKCELMLDYSELVSSMVSLLVVSVIRSSDIQQ